MRTPTQILDKVLGDDLEMMDEYQKRCAITAMKEYAKQWVDRSVEIADMNIDPTEIHSRISALAKEIDKQL